MYFFHLQPVQGLQPGDEHLCFCFSQWMLHKIMDNLQFLCHVLWMMRQYLEVVYTVYTVCMYGQQRIWWCFSLLIPAKISVSVVRLYSYVIHNHLYGAHYAGFLEECFCFHGIMCLYMYARACGLIMIASPHFAHWVCSWLNNNFPVRLCVEVQSPQLHIFPIWPLPDIFICGDAREGRNLCHGSSGLWWHN